MMKKIVTKGLLLIFVLSASLAMADTVYELEIVDSVEVNPCNLPIQFVGGVPEPTETIEWLAIEGTIQFSGQGTQVVTVTDLKDGTASLSMFEFGYLIKDVNNVVIRRDTVVMHYKGTDGCVGINIGLNPGVIECKGNPDIISAKVNEEMPSSDNYKYVWSTTSDGIIINDPDNDSTDFNISTPGLKTIQLDIYTLPFENWVGTSTVSFDSDCLDRYTLEGTVTANEYLWNDGMIYLYNAPDNKLLDSVRLDDGIYQFSNVLLGTYTLYAVPYTDNSLAEISTDFVPTYYVNKQHLVDANTFEIVGNTFSVDLALMDAVLASLDRFNSGVFSTYPNPFSDELTIKSDLVAAEIIVSNIQGTIIYNGALEQSTNINTSDWINGVYFIEVKTQSAVKTLKVVK